MKPNRPSETRAGALSAPDALARKVLLLPIDQLVPYARNARLHKPRQIKKIAASIERFGFTNPILIDRNNNIIAGHGRWKAAQSLGMTHVPTIRLEHLTEVEVRAYVLADNKLPEEAEWDREVLVLELQGLSDLEFDVGITGFETAEIDLLLEEVGEKSKDTPSPDAIPNRSKVGASRNSSNRHRDLCKACPYRRLGGRDLNAETKDLQSVPRAI